MGLSGLFEMFSLAAVIPFLSVISDPNKFIQSSFLKSIKPIFNFSSTNEVIILATAIFIFAAIFTSIIRLINLWLSSFIAARIANDLSVSAYRKTLYQSYSYHIEKNTSSIIAKTTTQISRTVNVLNFALLFLASLIVAIGILITIFIINWQLALSTSLIFFTLYIFLGKSTKRRLFRNGQVIAKSTNKQIKSLQEGLGSIREMLLYGSQKLYLKTYEENDYSLRNSEAKNKFLQTFPRYVFELIGISFIAFLGMIISINKNDGTTVVQTLGVVALATQKLLPASQQIYSCWAGMNANAADVMDVLSMLNQKIPRKSLEKRDKNFKFNSDIKLQNIYFSYDKTKPILKGINLRIKKGERVGIIGKTGSGKSTLIDLIMGLLEPTSGKILVDGFDLHDYKKPSRIVSWRSNIAHVPQSLYLTDSSIYENIVFENFSRKNDYENVAKAAARAQINAFIESLKYGYDTNVGERGVKLSGGQRQRIGIARALYKNSTLIFFDEATSALDKISEEEVVKSIDRLKRDLTIIMIAHRTSTLMHCDRIVCLENGKITKEGKPDEILQI